ncbi:MAG: META domain-containing protein [Ignavibacteria bacterium]
MKKISLLKVITIVIFPIIFISCSKSLIPNNSPKNPQLIQARKDSLIKIASGIYSGKTPCADCEAVIYTVTLLPSRYFSTKSIYAGKDVKPFEITGKWRMIGDSIIVLDDIKGSQSYLQIINNNTVRMLDASMQKITGMYETMFVLTRGEINSDSLNKMMTEIKDTTYILEVINGQPISKKEYTNGIPELKFDIRKATVSGSTGCNRLNGEVKITGNQISFSNLAMTRMMCPGNSESDFLSVLKNAKTFKTENNTLYLMDDSGLLAVFKNN